MTAVIIFGVLAYGGLFAFGCWAFPKGRTER